MRPWNYILTLNITKFFREPILKSTYTAYICKRLPLLIYKSWNSYGVFLFAPNLYFFFIGLTLLLFSQWRNNSNMETQNDSNWPVCLEYPPVSGQFNNTESSVSWILMNRNQFFVFFSLLSGNVSYYHDVLSLIWL